MTDLITREQAQQWLLSLDHAKIEAEIEATVKKFFSVYYPTFTDSVLDDDRVEDLVGEIWHALFGHNQLLDMQEKELPVRALSSAGERYPDTIVVGGSNPPVPTRDRAYALVRKLATYALSLSCLYRPTDRPPDYGSGSWGFESLWRRKG